MGLDHLLWSVLIGLAAGWLASRIMQRKNLGLLGNIVLGVIGAVIGGFVFNLLNISANSLLGSLVSATVGAVILIYLIGLIKKI